MEANLVRQVKALIQQALQQQEAVPGLAAQRVAVLQRLVDSQAQGHLIGGVLRGMRGPETP